jgi:hypothetical protein
MPSVTIVLGHGDRMTSKMNFERAVREFVQWHAVPEKERSPAPAWWWQPAFELRDLQEVMIPLWCHRLELPLSSTYAAGAAVLLATLADQKSLPWPEEFPRKIEREKQEPDASQITVEPVPKTRRPQLGEAEAVAAETPSII